MFEFLDMGKYTAHIWSAYGITFTVLIVNIFLPVMQNKNLLKKMKRRLNISGEQS